MKKRIRQVGKPSCFLYSLVRKNGRTFDKQDLLIHVLTNFLVPEISTMKRLYTILRPRFTFPLVGLLYEFKSNFMSRKES